MLPKLLTTNLAAVDPHREHLNIMAFGDTITVDSGRALRDERCN